MISVVHSVIMMTVMRMYRQLQYLEYIRLQNIVHSLMTFFFSAGILVSNASYRLLSSAFPNSERNVIMHI